LIGAGEGGSASSLPKLPIYCAVQSDQHSAVEELDRRARRLGENVFMTRRSAFATSPSNPDVKEIQTIPERKADMPYAPAIRVESPCGLLFISGATPSPLYHKHPHVLSEHDHPNSIVDQTRRAMETIKTILDHEGLTWTDVVKVTKYLTDIRDQDAMVTVLKEYFGEWTPASTTICINQLSTPGARVELDMIAAFPRDR
jgi:2-iminobutanoate/2-iminopropanoate deaminase